MEARYDVDLFLDWPRRTIRVETTIDIDNTSGGPVTQLHLNTIAAKLGKLRRLRAFVDDAEVTADTVGQTIRVPLPATLGAGESTIVRVKFRATLRTTTGSRTYLFSKNRGIAHMYRWIPGSAGASPSARTRTASRS